MRRLYGDARYEVALNALSGSWLWRMLDRVLPVFYRGPHR